MVFALGTVVPPPSTSPNGRTHSHDTNVHTCGTPPLPHHPMALVTLSVVFRSFSSLAKQSSTLAPSRDAECVHRKRSTLEGRAPAPTPCETKHSKTYAPQQILRCGSSSEETAMRVNAADSPARATESRGRLPRSLFPCVTRLWPPPATRDLRLCQQRWQKH